MDVVSAYLFYVTPNNCQANRDQNTPTFSYHKRLSLYVVISYSQNREPLYMANVFSIV